MKKGSTVTDWGRKMLQSLNPLIQSLNTVSNIEAVLCYGSYAEGTQDDKSDIDLLVICKETIPSAELRKKVYEKNYGSQIILGKSHENWETAWTPINDEFVLNDKKIEIGYNLSKWVPILWTPTKFSLRLFWNEI